MQVLGWRRMHWEDCTDERTRGAGHGVSDHHRQRTVDANLSYIATRLGEIGIRMAEARVVPDDEAAVVEAVNACRARYTYVFTTGGIGPTHDDITAACVAKAFGRRFERNHEAERRLLAY